MKTLDVLAASFAIHRFLGGYHKEGNITNKLLLEQHVHESKSPFQTVLRITEHDINNAQDAISFLQCLALKKLARPLSDYEQKLLELVAKDEFNENEWSSLGLTSSIPDMYTKQSSMENWDHKEQILGRNSNFVEKDGAEVFMNLTVEFTRYITKLETNLVCCTDSNNNLVKFFTKYKVIPGSNVRVQGKVKPHKINEYTGFKETMVSRVKILC